MTPRPPEKTTYPSRTLSPSRPPSLKSRFVRRTERPRSRRRRLWRTARLPLPHEAAHKSAGARSSRKPTQFSRCKGLRDGSETNHVNSVTAHPSGCSEPSRRAYPSQNPQAACRQTMKGAPAMATIEKSIEVNTPITAAYNQWTQFEEFPHFMEGVEGVRQLDDRRLHWRARFGGETHEWDAEITEQLPDERVAWRNIDGKDNAGVVTFHKIDGERSRVMVQMDWVPDG